MRIHQPFSRCSVATQPRHGPFVPPAQYGSSALPTPWRTRKSLACGVGPQNGRGANCSRRRRSHPCRVNSGSSPSPSASPHPLNEAPPHRESGPGAWPAPDLGEKRRQGQRTEPACGSVVDRVRRGCGADDQRLRPVRACPPPPVRESPPGRSAREGRRPRAPAGRRERVLREWSCRVRYPAWQGLNRRCPVASVGGTRQHRCGGAWCVAIVMVGCAATAVLGQGLPAAAAAARPARAASASSSDQPEPSRCPFWYSSVPRHDLPASPDGPEGRGSRCDGRPGSAG